MPRGVFYRDRLTLPARMHGQWETGKEAQNLRSGIKGKIHRDIKPLNKKHKGKEAQT